MCNDSTTLKCKATEIYQDDENEI